MASATTLARAIDRNPSGPRPPEEVAHETSDSLRGPVRGVAPDFTGDPSLTAALDPCITGTPQPAVSDGWWLLLLLAPGDYTLQSTATSPGGHPTSQTFIVKVRLDDD
jgi:hypothetical protein